MDWLADVGAGQKNDGNFGKRRNVVPAPRLFAAFPTSTLCCDHNTARIQTLTHKSPPLHTASALAGAYAYSDSAIMEDDGSDIQEPAKLYLTRLRLALAPYTVHFQSPGYIKDETLRMLERDVVKKTLEESRRSFELRYVLVSKNELPC